MATAEAGAAGAAGAGNDGDALAYARGIKMVPYGVLGSALLWNGQMNYRAAPLPEAVPGCCIVDPAGLHHIQGPNGTSGAGGAAGDIYKWIELAQFPADVVTAVTAVGAAKHHAYTRRSDGAELHVIHAVGPDFRRRGLWGADRGEPPFTRPEAVAALGTAYANILLQFVGSGRRVLRLLPVSGGIFAGPYAGELPVLTLEGLAGGFAQLPEQAQAALRGGAVEVNLCVFAEVELSGFARAGFNTSLAFPPPPPPPKAVPPAPPRRITMSPSELDVLHMPENDSAQQSLEATMPGGAAVSHGSGGKDKGSSSGGGGPKTPLEKLEAKRAEFVKLPEAEKGEKRGLALRAEIEELIDAFSAAQEGAAKRAAAAGQQAKADAEKAKAKFAVDRAEWGDRAAVAAGSGGRDNGKDKRVKDEARAEGSDGAGGSGGGGSDGSIKGSGDGAAGGGVDDEKEAEEEDEDEDASPGSPLAVAALLSRLLGAAAGHGSRKETLQAMELRAARVASRRVALEPHHFAVARGRSFGVDGLLDGVAAADPAALPARAREAYCGKGLAASVEDVAPECFQAVRAAFGYRFGDYAASLGDHPLKPIGAGGGRSGAAFYLSADDRFVVKSMPSEETAFLLTLLESYCRHMFDHLRGTLLPRFLGLYRVKLPRISSRGAARPVTKAQKPVTWLVMPNLFHTPASTGVVLRERYDLKGSTYMRYSEPLAVKQARERQQAEALAGAPSQMGFGRRKSLLPSQGLAVATAALDDSAHSAASEEAPELLPVVEVLKDLNFCPNCDPNKAKQAVPGGGGGPGGRSVSTIAGRIPGEQAFLGVDLKSSLKGRSVSSSSSIASSFKQPRPELASPLASKAAALSPERPPSAEEVGGSGHGSLPSSSSHGGDLGSPGGFGSFGVGGVGGGISGGGAGAPDRCRCLRLGSARKQRLKASVASDTRWLCEHGIMDYSLLLGVGTCSLKRVEAGKAEAASYRAKADADSDDGDDDIDDDVDGGGGGRESGAGAAEPPGSPHPPPPHPPPPVGNRSAAAGGGPVLPLWMRRLASAWEEELGGCCALPPAAKHKDGGPQPGKALALLGVGPHRGTLSRASRAAAEEVASTAAAAKAAAAKAEAEVAAAEAAAATKAEAARRATRFSAVVEAGGYGRGGVDMRNGVFRVLKSPARSSLGQRGVSKVASGSDPGSTWVIAELPPVDEAAPEELEACLGAGGAGGSAAAGGDAADSALRQEASVAAAAPAAGDETEGAVASAPSGAGSGGSALAVAASANKVRTVSSVAAEGGFSDDEGGDEDDKKEEDDEEDKEEEADEGVDEREWYDPGAVRIRTIGVAPL